VQRATCIRYNVFAALHESGSGTDPPVVKPLTSMTGIVRGADQDFDVPGDPVMDRP
jgi:hypothetical protein